MDLKPALDEQQLDLRLIRDLDKNGKKQISNMFKAWLPASLIPVFLEQLALNPAKAGHQVSALERKRIRNLMKNFRFSIKGHRSFKEAIITAGGIPLDEISSKTLESKRVKGLYFAGEMIDLDAETGGYNLQIAWSTGWLAGKSSMKRV
jgi:predicted Rossmann fold flavoprotein